MSNLGSRRVKSITNDQRRARAAVPMFLSAALLFLSAAALTGCDEDCDGCAFDSHPPAIPRGLYSITGDEEVELRWVPNDENDLDGYDVFRRGESHGDFRRIATVSEHAQSFVDREVVNGRTYWYAISAFDRSDNESELTPENVFDTPRPEGFSVHLHNAADSSTRAGFDFSQRDVVDADSDAADVYFWSRPSEGPWMIATERSEEDFTDIQDAGFLPLRDVGWAPENGWSPRGEVALIEGHSYVVWTWDNHFAKFRVVSVDADEVVFDWAYQTDEGNPELFVPVEPGSLTRLDRTAKRHQLGLAAGRSR